MTNVTRGWRSWRTAAAIGAVLVLVVLIWAGMRPPPDVVGGITLSVQSPAAAVKVGTEFTLDVRADVGDYALTAADLRIAYDARFLKAVSIRPGGLTPLELAPGSVSGNTATITVASGKSPAMGSGVIARVTFRAVAAGSSDIALAAGTQATAVGYAGNVAGSLIPARIIAR